MPIIRSVIEGIQLNVTYFYFFLIYLISVDGGWSQWSSWICDKKTGEKERVRECGNPSPLNGGQYCLGSHNEKETCAGENWFLKIFVCQLYFITYQLMEGGVSGDLGLVISLQDNKAGPGIVTILLQSMVDNTVLVIIMIKEYVQVRSCF